MKNTEQKRQGIYPSVIIILCFTIMISSCTKYNTNTTTTTTSVSNGSGPTPLPPLYGGGGTGSGGTGSGGAGINSTPQSYVQALLFAGISNSYITLNDSISLKQDGGYTPVYSGNGLLKYKVGAGTNYDAVYTTALYYLRPYSFYTYVVFRSPATAAGETMLWNDNTTPAAGTAQVRFISLDPLSTVAPISFKLTNYLDNFTIINRTYLDNRTDSNLCSFKTITPGFSNVTFIYRDTTTITFQQNFESGKKYTVFALASNYITSNKGTLPISYYQIARHN